MGSSTRFDASGRTSLAGAGIRRGRVSVGALARLLARGGSPGCRLHWPDWAAAAGGPSLRPWRAGQGRPGKPPAVVAWVQAALAGYAGARPPVAALAPAACLVARGRE